MTLAIPPELKKISPYVRRAEELDKDKSSPESRLVAYYLRQYAVHQGIPLSGTSLGAKTCLGHLLGNLEEEKAAMNNFTRQEAAFLCRAFANKVFDKADGEDRMGMANKGTAKTFYAAANFLQMLEQFSDDNDESVEVAEDKKRILYAKWKATEILKAIKEGRAPTPGGYGEDRPSAEEEQEEGEPAEPAKKEDAPPTVETVDDEEEEDAELLMPPPAPSSKPTLVQPPAPPQEPEEEEEEDPPEEENVEVTLGPPPSYPGEDAAAPSGHAGVDRPPLSFDLPPTVVPKPLPAPVAPPPKKTGLFGRGKKKPVHASRAQLADALELTRFALAALEDKDGALGAERLEQALAALGR